MVEDCKLILETASFQSVPAELVEQAGRLLSICNCHTQPGQWYAERPTASQRCAERASSGPVALSRINSLNCLAMSIIPTTRPLMRRKGMDLC